MLVKNWMSKNPRTISSDLTAKEAMFIFEENHVPFISVVDNGRFRGFLARRDLREAASWTIATQDMYEMEYFNNELKVKDIMVRKPVTISLHDTVETALKKGKQFGRPFLPVMDGDTLVGTMSNRDLANALNQILNGEQGYHRITVELDSDNTAAMRQILEEIFQMGLGIEGLFTLKAPESDVKRLIIKFKAKCLKKITTLLEDKGYRILEVVRQN